MWLESLWQWQLLTLIPDKYLSTQLSALKFLPWILSAFIYYLPPTCSTTSTWKRGHTPIPIGRTFGWIWSVGIGWLVAWFRLSFSLNNLSSWLRLLGFADLIQIQQNIVQFYPISLLPNRFRWYSCLRLINERQRIESPGLLTRPQVGAFQSVAFLTTTSPQPDWSLTIPVCVLAPFCWHS